MLATDHVYDEDYYVRNYLTRRSEQLERSREHVSLLKEYLSSGPILDYGCGSGAFLKAVSDAGFTNSVGADVSQAALNLVKSTVGDHITTVKLDSEQLPPMRFEAICLIDSISHIPDPASTLSGLIKHHLRPDGVLFIRTPAIPNAYFSRLRMVEPLLPQKRMAKLAFASRHVLFNTANLERFVQRLGMEVAAVRTEPDYPPDVQGGRWTGLVGQGVVRILQLGIKSTLLVARPR